MHIDFSPNGEGGYYANIDISPNGAPQHTYIYQFIVTAVDDGMFDAYVIARMSQRNWLNVKKGVTLDDAFDFLEEEYDLVKAGEYNETLDFLSDDEY